MQKTILFSTAAVLAVSCTSKAPQVESNQPNIIVIYVDDLGYGDAGCYGGTGAKTPNIDRMAANGLRFTDGHCTAATCTPSRYSLLTGSYAFRSNAEILPGDAPLLIDPNGPTVPAMLKKAGYKTGVIGKWHLGLGNGNLNWNTHIKPGPAEIGFDYSFLIPATGDRVPCVFVENQSVVNLDTTDPITVSYEKQVGDWPTGMSNPEMLKVGADPQHSGTIVNGISRIGWMTGGKSALWVDEDFPDVLTQKAKDFISKNKNNPFFLYFAYHDIHDPNIVNARFEGTSPMGARGDAIVQMDWCTGQIMDYLDKLGIAENTLIVFSSDNGPVLTDGYFDQGLELLGNHKPAGPLRGGKYSSFEAGTRVPTITYWPGTIQPGVSDALVNHVDLYASFARLSGQEKTAAKALDSEDYLDVFLGKSTKGRTVMLEEAFAYGIRQGNWKYIEAGKGTDWIAKKNIESGNDTVPQLYDLSVDVGETNNLAEIMPNKVIELQAILDEIRKNK